MEKKNNKEIERELTKRHLAEINEIATKEINVLVDHVQRCFQRYANNIFKYLKDEKLLNLKVGEETE